MERDQLVLGLSKFLDIRPSEAEEILTKELLKRGIGATTVTSGGSGGSESGGNDIYDNLPAYAPDVGEGGGFDP